MKKRFLLGSLLFGLILFFNSFLYSPQAFSFTKTQIEKYLKEFKSKNADTQRDEIYKILDTKKPSDYFPILVKLLDPKSMNSYYSVVDVLGSIGDKRAIPAFFDVLSKLDDNYPRDYSIPYALSKMAKKNPEIFQIILNALNDKNYKIRCNVAVALGDIKNKKAIPGLIKTLKDENKWVREAGAEALGNFKDSNITKSLVSALKDDSADVRKASVNSLGRIADKSTLPDVITISQKDVDSSVQRTAITTLSKFNDESANDAIIIALKDKELITEAAFQLGELGIQKAIPPLLEILNTEKEDNYILASVVRALGKLKAGGGASKYVELLNSADNYTKQSAIYALGTCKAKEYLPNIIMFLRDKDTYIKEEAAKALGDMEDPRSIPFLLRAYNTASAPTDTYFKENVLRSLAKFSDKSLVLFFIKILDSQDKAVEYVKTNVLTALGKTGEQDAINYLSLLFEKNLASSLGFYENDIIKALGASGDYLALEPLLNILEKYDTYYSEMNPALTKIILISSTTVPTLIEKLENSKNERVIKTLMDVLGRGGAKEALPAIEKQKDTDSSEIETLANESINLIQAISEGQEYIKSLDPIYKKGTEMILTDNFDMAEKLFNDELSKNPNSAAAYERLGYINFANSSFLKSFANFKKAFSLNMDNMALDLIGKSESYDRDKLYFIIQTAMMEAAKEDATKLNSLGNLFNGNVKIKSEMAHAALYQLAKTDKKAIEIIRTRILKDSPKARDLQAQDKVFTMVFRVSTWESGFVSLLPYSRFSLTTPYGKIYGWTNARGFFSCPNILISEDENYDNYKVGDVDTDPTIDAEYASTQDKDWWEIVRKIKKQDMENWGARADEYFCKNVNDRALILYDYELKFNPYNTLALVKTGVIHYEMGNKQKAKECWDSAEKMGQKYLNYIIPELACYKKSYNLLFEKMKEKIEQKPESVEEFIADRAEQSSDYLQVITTAAFLKTTKDNPKLLDTLKTMLNSGDKNTVETAFFTLWKLADKNLDARKILQEKMPEKVKLTSYKVKLTPNTYFVLKTTWGRIHAKTDAQGIFRCNYLPDGEKEVNVDTLDKGVLKILY